MKYFNGKKKQVKVEPRKIDDIQKELGDLLFSIGKTRYTIYAYEIQLEIMNKKAVDLNNEAAARNALDKPKEEVKNG